MKKWILPILFCIPFVIAIIAANFNSCTEAGCNPVDYARITDVEYRAEVVDEPGSCGKVIITERITFDIHAAFKNNLFWELWRDLVEDEYDGVKIRYNVLSVKQILEDGTEIEYEESPRLYWDDEDYVNTNTRYGPGKWFHSPGPYDEDYQRYECVFFYVDGIYREKMTFEIQYEMTNAALRYGDCSDLYISMYSGESVYDLESFKAEILIPDELMPSPGNYKYTTYGTKNYDFPVEESDTVNPGYHTFMMELDEKDLKFTSYSEFLEFDLVTYGEDKHIFTEYASFNDWYYDDCLVEILDEQDEYAKTPERFRILKVIVLILFIILSGVVIFYGFYRKHKIMSKYFFYEPEVAYEQYREIPSELDPQFAAELVFCKDKKKAKEEDLYAALMLSLARKGYIEIKEKANDDIDIYIKKCPYRGAQNAVPNGPAGGYAQPTYSQPTYQQPTYSQPTYSQGGFSQDPFAQTGFNQDPFAQPANKYYGVNQEIRGNVHTGIDLTYNPSFTTSYSQNRSTPMSNSYSLNNYNISFNYSTPTNNGSPLLANFEGLTESESHFFGLLARHAKDNFITMNEFRNSVATDYANTDSFLNKLRSSSINVGVQKGYVQTATYTRPRNAMLGSATLFTILGLIFLIGVNLYSKGTRMDYAFGAFTIFGISCLIASAYLRKTGRGLVLLSAYGETEYAKWRGLYNFLNSSTLINERSHIELPLWEQYLVYATAFGISEKVTKAIKICCPNYQSSDVLRVNGSHSHGFRRHGRRLRHSVHSGSSVARSGGGGFGYGGGGRGGGGGGGGH